MSIGTYIVHYTGLKERRWNLDKYPTIRSLNPIYVTEREVMEEKHKIKHISEEKEIFAQVDAIMHLLEANIFALSRTWYLDNAEHMGNMLRAQALKACTPKSHELSCQHMRAMKMFLDSKHNLGMILEDDAIPIHSLQTQNNILNRLTKNYNREEEVFIDISDSLGLGQRNMSEKLLCKEVKPGRTRCASSYIVTRRTAECLIKESSKISMPIDWHYSYILNERKIKTVWLTVPLFSQGSDYEYKSNREERGSIE